jgi:hypothetical protein
VIGGIENIERTFAGAERAVKVDDHRDGGGITERHVTEIEGEIGAPAATAALS